ncbi:MAG: exonuclease SbcCD subunit D [Candidatus Limiplasma sp.]|nr:exonuclease SbcCD subunit D [Candidatus Limiplasma sp.]
MRLFHISDLHLGKKLSEAPLVEDQRFMLAQLCALVKTHAPHAVLIAGDVFDKATPSAEAVGLLDAFLTELAALDTQVVIISGNHDSAERLAYGAALFARQRVHISPVFDRAHAAIQPIRLADEHGEVCLWPLPFIKPAHVRAALPDAKAETYTQAVAAVLDTLPLDTAQRNVLLCHQYMTGAERSDSEELSIGGLDNVDAGILHSFDYVALGHLHRAQSVGRPTVRYAGSPLKYSFSEVRDHKSATLVTLGQKGAVAVETLPLTPLHELRALRGTYAELTLRQNYADTHVDDYLHITLTDEADIPDALAKLQSIYPNLLRLDYDNVRTREALAPLAAAPEGRTPLMMLADFYQGQYGAPLSDAQRAYALPLLERVWEGKA